MPKSAVFERFTTGSLSDPRFAYCAICGGHAHIYQINQIDQTKLMRTVLKTVKNGSSLSITIPKHMCEILDLHIGDNILLNVHKVVKADGEKATRPPTDKPVLREQMLEWMEQGNPVDLALGGMFEYLFEPHTYKVVLETVPAKYGGYTTPEEYAKDLEAEE